MFEYVIFVLKKIILMMMRQIDIECYNVSFVQVINMWQELQNRFSIHIYFLIDLHKCLQNMMMIYILQSSIW